jgi:phage tail-like protein
VTCVTHPTFRLLDDLVGWDPRTPDGLTGVIIADGAIELAASARPVPPDRVLPPRLAWMCETCTWWLATTDGVLRLGPCDDGFVAWEPAVPARAIAARGVLLAVVGPDGEVSVYDTRSGRQEGSARVRHASAVGLTPWGTLLVGDDDGGLHELELSGLLCADSDAGGPVTQIAFTAEGACETVVVHPDGEVDPAVLARLRETGVTAATERGFCLAGRGCFDWDGEPLDAAAIGSAGARYETLGQYLSEPLDSGIGGCRWHRVRIDADVPETTTVRIAVATTDGPIDDRAPQPAPADPWSGFPPGDPHPSDWVQAAPGVTDVTLTTPPGRYAYVRLRLTGDGSATPAVHQVRLDLPRRTSLDDLPAVFSEDADARDFSERFLSLFDAQLEDVDETVARRDALLDAAALPDDALGWLASLLGVGFEAEMTADQRRALIAAAPALYHRRGTPSGLVDTLRIALGVDATVQELGPERPWAAAGAARLGSFRLFGRSRARVRLGTSRLGSAPLNARGNPDDDARLAGANRIVVTAATGSPRPLVERVVRSQVPAHVVPTVRVPDPGFVLTELHVGVDTVLLAPGPAVVGSVRLGHEGVLRGGRMPSCLPVVGRPLIVGLTTGME